MKKILALALVAIMLVSVVACGETADDTTTEKVETTIKEEETTIKEEETTIKEEETSNVPEAKELVTGKILCSADTYSEEGTDKNMNESDPQRLRVKAAEGSTHRISYFLFDTTEYAGKACAKATFRFRLDFASSKAEMKEGRDVNLYAVADAWDEATLTGKNKPALGEKILDVEDSLFVDDAWVELDITEYVNAHLGEKISLALVNEGNKATTENHLDIVAREKGEGAPELVLG